MAPTSPTFLYKGFSSKLDAVLSISCMKSEAISPTDLAFQLVTSTVATSYPLAAYGIVMTRDDVAELLTAGVFVTWLESAYLKLACIRRAESEQVTH